MLTRNYIVRIYAQSPYLDGNVTTERDSFHFGREKDMAFPIGRSDIEKRIANIARDAFKDVVQVRYEKKRKQLESYAGTRLFML